MHADQKGCTQMHRAVARPAPSLRQGTGRSATQDHLRASLLIRVQRWLGESEQSDKWIFCPSAARMPRIRREHVETSTSYAQPGLQGEGGLGCPQGREDAGRAGAAI